MHKYFCTVFTPTYNRAELLRRLYESLVNQEFQDFEWVVVDDGSKDHTSDIVKEFMSEDKIRIKYVRVENGGKHRAINKGLELAEGKAFAIVDSDDYLTTDALKKVKGWFDQIENNKERKFGGVAGSRGYNQTELIANKVAKKIGKTIITDVLLKQVNNKPQSELTKTVINACSE